jgi:hypothetical protein
MKVNLAILALVLASGCAMRSSDGGESSSGSLVGGKTAGDNEIPSALIVRNNCTASRVGPRAILIAGHCVTDTNRRGENTVLARAFEPGAVLQISSDRVVHNSDGQVTKFTDVTIASTSMHPSWEAECMARGEECMYTGVGRQLARRRRGHSSHPRPAGQRHSDGGSQAREGG